MPERMIFHCKDYSLKKGVKFEFPDAVIPAGGYVVVAADPAVFRKMHPAVTSVFGPWEGKLGNSGDEIVLEDAEGEKVDAVEYSDQGEWATRKAGNARASYNRNSGLIFSSRRSSRYNVGGWEWDNPADGQGHSLELCSAALSNQSGQNWKSSTPRGGTPGAQNSRYSPDIAPIIRDVAHRPVIPTPEQSVRVSAEIRDELPRGVTAELLWRCEHGARREF